MLTLQVVVYSPISDGEILKKIKLALGADTFSAFWARDILFHPYLPSSFIMQMLNVKEHKRALSSSF